MFKYLVVVLIAFVLAACGGREDSNDPLVGTYDRVDGQPLLKIEKNGGQYVAYNRSKSGGWQPVNEKIKTLTPTDLLNFTAGKESSDVAGIEGLTFDFFKAPIGWSILGFTTQTGYVVFSGQNAVDVKRVP
ncbi:hypothetical protein P3T23_009059 [Paraburkholderia sp. GAS448]|jgi:hypothetical protein|uniref:hypothetical protein n=1 Tax=Paraburkholderia sp. GAS448 TaxID=3035136 RepID=UPI003D258336